jgi:molecular chaperone HscB
MNEAHANPHPAKCQSCQRPLDSPVCCNACHTLYPVDTSEDHFRLFGLPRRYHIDPTDLHRRFLAISRNVHPDLFGTQAPEMRNLALRLSAQINEAYETLKDPLLRAEYLLESSGGKSSAADKSAPGELLAEIMMLREEIEEAKAAADTETMTSIRAHIDARRHAVHATVMSLAEHLDEPSDAVRSDLRRQLNAMKYLNNLLSELD